MARKDDPRVADLARYRKAREQARRQPPPKPQRPQPTGSQSLLGSRKNAGLILALVVIVLLALYVGPMIL